MGIPGLTQYDQKAVPLVQKSIAFGDIGASYSIVTSVFSNPVILLILYSSLNADVQLSLDGTNDWLPIPAGGTLIIDEKTNGIVLEGWRGVYVKDLGNPTSGSLYVSGFTI